MEFLNNLYFNVIDIIVISIILISCIVATFRGFVKEAFSIASWIFAIVVSFQLYNKFKLELSDYFNHEIISDVIAFGFPFISTLFVSTLISSWLSPKFSISGFLVIDKVFGFIFGGIRGILFVILIYLGISYLLGKEKKLPNIILETHTYRYIKPITNKLRDLSKNNIELENSDINKMNEKSQTIE